MARERERDVDEKRTCCLCLIHLCVPLRPTGGVATAPRPDGAEVWTRRNDEAKPLEHGKWMAPF